MVEIYSDGGCRGNPGIGAWAFFITADKGQTGRIVASGSKETTNNMMELTGAIQGIQYYLKKKKNPDTHIVLKTDSQYIVNSMVQWAPGWKARGWIKKDKKPIKNLDLIKELFELSLKYHIKFEWVKGHSGVLGNEICDEALNQVMDIISSNSNIPFQEYNHPK